MQSMFLWLIIIWRVKFSNADTGRYELFKTKVSYEQAVSKCKSEGKEILTLHTDEEYDEFISWLPSPPHNAEQKMKDVWVGLKQKTSGKRDYSWVDDNTTLEGQICWKNDEPRDEENVQCAYMDYDGKFSAEDCTVKTEKIACYHPVSETYHLKSTEATFYDAAVECSKHGHYLPIIQTKDQREKLETEIVSDNKVWVGLIEVKKNVYQWINGDVLPRFKWAGDEKGKYVHGHREIKKNCFELHAPGDANDNKADRPYVCQKKIGKDRNKTLDNYYKFEAGNAVMFLPPINISYILKRTECAMYCSRDLNCRQYTLSGTVCKTYGKGLFWESEQHGVNLFIRRTRGSS